MQGIPPIGQLTNRRLSGDNYAKRKERGPTKSLSLAISPLGQPDFRLFGLKRCRR